MATTMVKALVVAFGECGGVYGGAGCGGVALENEW